LPGDHGRLDARRQYGRWYFDTYTVPYDDDEHWNEFFGRVADGIVSQFRPRSVLDAGCARGFLVAALRRRGVDASGFDLSDVAIEEAVEDARPFVRVGSLVEPIDGAYDLVTCIEVIEHLDPADTARAVANLAGAGERVLLSSTPGDLQEPTHVNVQPPERWAQLFAAEGMYRDFHHEVGFLSPWAALYRREPDRSMADVVIDYDREWSRLRAEVIDLRTSLLQLHERMDGLAARANPAKPGEVEEELRKEILRLRDLVAGAESTAGTARGRVEQLTAELERYLSLEQRLNDVLTSRSWRLIWAAGLPVRRLKGR
jgi:SAM-dependent methyltransferase